MGTLLGLFAGLALVPSLLFTVSYSRKSWWKSPEGRYLFLHAVVMVSIFAAFLVPGGLALPIWVGLMFCLAVAQWALYFLYIRAQRERAGADRCPTCNNIVGGSGGPSGATERSYGHVD